MTLHSRNPFRPDETVAAVEETSPEALESTLDSARVAQERWRDLAATRCAALGDLADLIAEHSERLTALIVREVGKPVGEARAEVGRGVAILRYYAQAALDPEGQLFPASTTGTTVAVRREPLGIVLAICPWNFPLAIPIWKAAPALAYGNAVLLKPAGPAIGVAAALGELAGTVLPERVLSVIPIRGAAVGGLLDDERIQAVSFTGSTPVGLEIGTRMAGRAAPFQAEMGGHNPAIVREDADIERAAAAIVAGAMPFAGQKCTATRRVIAVGGVKGAIEGAIARHVEELRVGDPADEATAVGPLISAEAAEEFRDRVTRARERGARVVAEAAVPEAANGHFVSPTVLSIDDVQDEVNQEETFGPLLSVIAVADDAAAVLAANATRYGLVGAVHGRDLAAATAIAARLRVGMQRVNAPTPGVDYYAPFGGDGLSGSGPREQGRAAREFFTTTRTLTIVGT